MSRSQQSAVIDTAKATQAADQTNATTAVNNEQEDIGNYESQLKSYAASNPYLKGGEYDTATDQKLSGVADAGSGAINDALQTQAKRTGENATAATATAAEAARANLRDLSTGEAGATQNRIAGEAGYNQQVLSDTAVPAQIEQGIYGTSAGAADANLGINASTSATPGFWDTLGDSFAGGLGKAAGTVLGVCWIAAELYGGWFDPRTQDVRHWLLTEFVKRPYGRAVVWVYSRTGERIAKWIRRWPILRRVFLPIFNAALNKARGV